MLVSVSGSVADIEKTFQVTLRTYRHPRELRDFHAPDREPSLDIGIPVLGISALDDYHLPRPRDLKRKPFDPKGSMSPQSGSAPGGYLMGNDFRTAYAPGVALTGAGQSVALLQFDGYYPSDIAQYRALAGLPNIPLQNVLVDGYNGAAGVNNNEVAMDIEMVMSMAPGLSAILVYEAPNVESSWVDILSRIANDNLAKQISCSWGGGAANPTAEQIFQQMAAQGQSFFNASGDSGAFTGPIDFPSESPNITQVGGTTLSMQGSGSAWGSETTWNWSGSSGSSGGISSTYSIPAWQQGISMVSNQGSTSMRNIPDVSMAADNIYVIHDNGQTDAYGGTSAAAPLWAAFTALINQQATVDGRPAVGFLNPALYAIGKGTNAAKCFHDITTGNNTNSTSPNLFYAVPGYDLCTGWGTPVGAGLINTLSPSLFVNNCNLLAESGTPVNGVIDPGETVTFSIGLINAGADTTNLVATLLPSANVFAPSGPQTYGVLPGNGGVVNNPFTFTAAGNSGQSFTLNLQLQDGPVNLGMASYTLQFGRGVTFSQNFDSVSAPALPAGWTTSKSGSQSLWTTSINAANTAPNAAFASGASSAGVSELVSPAIPIVSTNAQLNFRHSYNLQFASPSARDGGVLEIKIGNNSFTDILSAGGSFVSGGYIALIGSGRNNPLAGRQAWTGNSGGFISTLINLPASAAGQSIQLKWRCGTDNSTASAGWYVDTIAIFDDSPVCAAVAADLGVFQSVSPVSPVPGQNFTYNLLVTNAGPDLAAGVTLIDVLPPGVNFVSATPGSSYSSGQVTCSLGTLPSGGSASITITAISPGGRITNSVSVTSITPEANPGDNNSTLVSLVLPDPPSLVTPLPGELFSVSVNSLSGLSYGLEYKNQLTDTNWTRLFPLVVGTGAPIILPDTNAPTSTRFYRVRYE